jgi:hypothetical protein
MMENEGESLHSILPKKVKKRKSKKGGKKKKKSSPTKDEWRAGTSMSP